MNKITGEHVREHVTTGQGFLPEVGAFIPVSEVSLKNHHQNVYVIAKVSSGVSFVCS